MLKRLKPLLTRKAMDNRDRYNLEKIGARIPKELLRQGIKTVKDSGELEERMAFVAKKTDDKRLKEMVARGDFREKDRLVVDEQVSKQIERHVEQAVAKEMRAGNIKPASKQDLKAWNPSQD